MPKKLRKHPHCLNCQTDIHDANYCPNCGQMNTTRQISLRQILHDLLGDYFTFDSRFFRSFLPLLRSPGFLTEQYISGRRTTYILPLRLYLFTSVFFFFVLSISGNIGKADLAANRVASQFDLHEVFKKYDGAVPEVMERTISEDILDHFRVTVNSIDSTAIFPRDSLRTMIATLSPDFGGIEREYTVRTIYSQFEFSRKKQKSASESTLAAIDSMLRISHFAASGGDPIALKNAISEKFYIERRKTPLDERSLSRKGSGPNLRFNGMPLDSLESGYMKTFGEKIIALISRGSEGGTLFLREVLNQMPKVIFVILPIFALLLKLFYVRQKIFYINHLIFSLHAHTVIFLYLLFPVLYPVWWTALITVTGIWLYLFFAMRNVYRQSRLMTFVKLNTLLICYFFPLLFGFIGLSILAVINV